PPNQRWPAMGQRDVALLLVGPTVQVVDLATLQERNRKPASLIGGAVLDLDPALAQRDSMAVDPLMGIADDEQVVGTFRYNRPHQTERLGAHILRLIDDHGAIRRRDPLALDQAAGVAQEVDVLLLPLFV